MATFEEALRGMDKAVGQATATTTDALFASAQRSVGPVVDQWPVRTGRSAAGWHATRTTAGGAVVNGVDYAGDVGPGLADELVPAVIAADAPRTTTEIEKPITTALEEV